MEEELDIFARTAIGAYDQVASQMRSFAGLIRTDPAFKTYEENAKRDLEATVNPRNIFEASALAVQLQAAWTTIGREGADIFGRHIFASDLSYAKAFMRIARATAPRDNPGAVDPIRISAAAVWSLLGDPQVADGFDPAIRLLRLLGVLEDHGGISATSSIADLWDSWDKRLNMKNWRTAVKDMRERTARSAARYARVAEDPDEPDAASFATVLQAYLADQTRTTNLLLEDPNSYVDTRRYIERSDDALPVPLVSTELGDFVVPLESFPAGDSVRFPRTIDKDGLRGWQRVVLDMHDPPRPWLLEAALDLEFRCKICDVAFSNEAMRPRNVRFS